MAKTLPAYAIVRPRVVAQAEGEARLLEEVVSEIVDEFPPGVVWLVGGPGSGKSTAIAHLAAIFADDARLAFLDEPSQEELLSAIDTALVVAATHSLSRSGLVLRLTPWGLDDLIEYLLASHEGKCNSVMTRLGRAADKSWTPELACVVLDRFAHDQMLADPRAAIEREVRSRLPNSRDFNTAAEYCLAVVVGDAHYIHDAQSELAKAGVPQVVMKLLRHSLVQIELAAERFAAAITREIAPRYLYRLLPFDLVSNVGIRCSADEVAIGRLRSLVGSGANRSAQSMAASILNVADPIWRPDEHNGDRCYFSGGWFGGADWPGVSLRRAELQMADFTSANLQNAILDEADAGATCFQSALLQNARLIGVRATRADFRNADLSGAKLSIAELVHAQFGGANLSNALLVKSDLSAADLSGANLSKADLCGAKLLAAVLFETDFSDAKLDDAYLDHCDLSTATLRGACFDRAFMTYVQLEDVLIQHAQFRGAHLQYANLTGSKLPAADFRGATLAYAHLAEIDWPAADLREVDLRGASFHMGSSRSGLVGSPIACEGSKTGFYTDEREERYFKRPEEIRKANLRGADLRGANVENVDFYLVDLREARLDRGQVLQAQKTGAILYDADAE